jgi:hypothetical protein
MNTKRIKDHYGFGHRTEGRKDRRLVLDENESGLPY